VFTRKGRSNQVTFSNFSGLYGAGFIAESNRLRGKFDKCTIKSRKDDGQNVNPLVGCASGIMVSNVQFFLKIVDDNRITRMFPGIDGMEIIIIAARSRWEWWIRISKRTVDLSQSCGCRTKHS
jgi:hypothetical protein